MVGTIDRNLSEKFRAREAQSASTPTTPELSTQNSPNNQSQVPKALHGKPSSLPQEYHFKKVSSKDNNISYEMEAILKRYKVDGSNPYNLAVASQDQNTLVVITDGATALKQNFGGSNGFYRFMYSIFGWFPRFFGAPRKDSAAKRYQEIFNYAESHDPNHMLHEKPKHLYKGLKANHYHSIAVFHKDTNKGRFGKTPDALAITDSYYYLVKTRLEADKQAQELDRSKLKELEKCYAVDKIIPLSNSASSLKDIAHQIAEGLYQSQGFDLLSFAGQVHQDSNVNSNDLNYQELRWHRLAETNDGKWKAFGEEELAEAEVFANDAEHKKYLANLVNLPIKMTFVRPKDQANKQLPAVYAYCDAWQQMYSGSSLRQGVSGEDQKQVELVEKVNIKQLEKHNATFNKPA